MAQNEEGTDKNMKKLLYLMPVDWEWIVQRPHYLALELMKYYDVTIVYGKNLLKRWKAQREYSIPENSKRGIAFPLQDKLPVLQCISDYTFKRAIGDMSNYDIVWCAEPLHYKFIKKYGGTVVWDCMDDYIAMTEGVKNKRYKEVCIRALVKRADIVFASSLKLTQMVKEYGAQNIYTLRNGCHTSKLQKIYIPQKKRVYHLGYIGTISDWLDYELLDKCLNENNDIVIHLIGPVVGTKKNVRKRLIYEGVVEHSRLYDSIRQYDCLIMPFLRNDIVLAVDPVKLYEYIAFGKPVIAIDYPEVRFFSNYVYLYKNHKECLDFLRKMKTGMLNVLYTPEQRINFLKENNWEHRGRYAVETLSSVYA